MLRITDIASGDRVLAARPHSCLTAAGRQSRAVRASEIIEPLSTRPRSTSVSSLRKQGEVVHPEVELFAPFAHEELDARD